MAILRQATPLVEQVSIDEAYLDLTPQSMASIEAWDHGIDIARAVAANHDSNSAHGVYP